MQKWEYKITNWVNEETMCQLGEEGWELVTVYSTETSSTYFFFKRPKSQSPSFILKLFKVAPKACRKWNLGANTFFLYFG